MYYIELKDQISSAEREYGIDSLDYISQAILHTIASANLNGRKIRSTDIHRMDLYGTYPTVLGRIEKLTQEGWIIKRDDSDDRREKYLETTPRTRAIFKKISKKLEKQK